MSYMSKMKVEEVELRSNGVDALILEAEKILLAHPEVKAQQAGGAELTEQVSIKMWLNTPDFTISLTTNLMSPSPRKGRIRIQKHAPQLSSPNSRPSPGQSTAKKDAKAQRDASQSSAKDGGATNTVVVSTVPQRHQRKRTSYPRNRMPSKVAYRVMQQEGSPCSNSKGAFAAEQARNNENQKPHGLFARLCRPLFHSR